MESKTSPAKGGAATATKAKPQGKAASQNKPASKPAAKSAPKQAAGTKKLQEENKLLQQKVQEQTDLQLRTQAELQNAHRRFGQELEKAKLSGLLETAPLLLETLDNLEKGLAFHKDAAQTPSDETSAESIRQGMELTHKALIEGMKKFNIEEINPLDEQFNPDYHEAFSRIKVEGQESGKIVAVLQKGYKINGRLLRAAKVQVAE